MSLGSGLWVSVSLRPRALVDFVDVTLADDDTNSILADDANKEIPSKMTIHVAEFPTNACGATC